MRPDCTSDLQKSLAERILVLDGAMGTTIRTYGLEESDARGTRFSDNDKDLLNNGDNLTVAPWGDLILCEDLVTRSPNLTAHLRGVTPKGEIYTLARNANNRSEFAGSTFSPDGTILFVNIQSPGHTLAITGQW
jgi:secreted PhoX family phosphatase